MINRDKIIAALITVVYNRTNLIETMHIHESLRTNNQDALKLKTMLSLYMFRLCTVGRTRSPG
jgi:hypothetical protein